MTITEEVKYTEIRSDMWLYMSVNELLHQQELMTTRMAHIVQLMSSSPSPSVQAMHAALSMGMADLTKLLDHRSAKEH